VYKFFIGCYDFSWLCSSGGFLGYLLCVESLYDVVENFYVIMVLLWVDGIV